MNRKPLAIPVLLALACLLPAAGSAQAPAGATFQCKDGTYSTAKTASGACSRHGGVAKAVTAAKPKPAPKAATTGRGAAPAGATFKCKDGTYSTAKTTTGACSRHGGVAQALAGGAAAAPAAPAAPTPSVTTGGGGVPAGATFQCKDGTYSTAKTSSGACSRHGGVDHPLTAAPAAAPAPGAAAPAAAAPAAAGAAAATSKAPMVARPADAPANATAKCRDGTYSASQQHSGACSHHGGVAEWYQ